MTVQQPTSKSGYPGQQSPSDSASEFNALHFIARQLDALINTATVVKVVSVTNSGGVSPVGMVDVQPLVKLIDSSGQTQSHDTVYKLPYVRLQGGANAVICDPRPGDLGIAVFADRDISTVRSTKAEAPPGSYRRFSMADGLYIGGVLNGTPQQYVRFTQDGNGTPTGMDIQDVNGNSIVMNSDGIRLNGVLFDRSGNISGAGTVDATGEGTFNHHTVGAHKHGGVQTGSGQTGTPTG